MMSRLRTACAPAGSSVGTPQRRPPQSTAGVGEHAAAEPLAGTIQESVVIGAIGGALVVGSIVLLDKLRIDDPVGAISVHGTAGIWGLLAVCITNPDATIGAQLLGIVVIFAWTFVAASIVWYILKATMGIRISEEEEYEGADLSETGIEAYPEFVKV